MKQKNLMLAAIEILVFSGLIFALLAPLFFAEEEENESTSAKVEEFAFLHTINSEQPGDIEI